VVVQLVEVLSYKPEFSKMSMEFFIDLIISPHYVPGVDSASKRNEYQEYFSGGVKAAFA
jgi:hypothetical protein